MLTERGICLNLNESEYKVTIDGITFYFSSKQYKEKFKAKVTEFISVETAKLYVRYKFNLNLDLFFMIVFYKKIEKRGFRIFDENKKMEITERAGFVNQLICY